MNPGYDFLESPFGQSTRQTMIPTNPIVYTQGQPVSVGLPRTGYLARIHWHFSGTLTVVLGGGTAALDVLGPWNLANRVRLIANSGQDVYSTSGYGNFIVEVTRGPRGFAPSNSGFYNPAYNTRIYGAPTAAGANVWEFGLTIPVAMNEKSEFGLILLQNEMAQVQFSMEFNPSIFSLTATAAPVLVTGAATATLTGQVTPTLERFAVPAEAESRPDITWLHQTLEFTQPVVNTGDNTINLYRDNVYVDLIHWMALNNAPNTLDIDRWRLQFNQSDVIYDFYNRPGLQLQRRRYDFDLPTGIITYPLLDQGFAGFGDERDTINGRATSELSSIVTVGSGATLGTNPRIATIVRQLVHMDVAPTRQ